MLFWHIVQLGTCILRYLGNVHCWYPVPLVYFFLPSSYIHVVVHVGSSHSSHGRSLWDWNTNLLHRCLFKNAGFVTYFIYTNFFTHFYSDLLKIGGWNHHYYFYDLNHFISLSLSLCILSVTPRPLWVDYPKEPATFTIENEYLIGEWKRTVPDWH